jgi:hypothetical protein
MFCSSAVLPPLYVSCDAISTCLQAHGLHLPAITLANAVPMLQDFLYNRSSVNLLAKFVHCRGPNTSFLMTYPLFMIPICAPALSFRSTH